MKRKEKMAPLAEDKIPSFVALGRQVAAATQLTPEQEAVRRRMLAAWRKFTVARTRSS
jgi:hypothetical protein